MDQPKIAAVLQELSNEQLKELASNHLYIWDRSIAWNTKDIIEELMRRLHDS